MKKTITKKNKLWIASFLFAFSAFFLFSQNVLAVSDWKIEFGSGSRPWIAVASSSDGTKLAAVVSGGYIYTSTDSGATWTERTNSGARSWYSITSSSDGTKLAAVVSGGYIYTSTDSGATWTERTNAGSRLWDTIASSSDGTKLVAGPANSGYIYTSTDSGATWTERTNAGSKYWISVTSSSDGTKLAAVVSGGYIYTSTDSGATWTERTNSGARSWYSITSSSDGTKLAAVVSGGYIYTSTDSGATWTERTNSGALSWRSITSSSDGTKLVAAAYNGYIYTSTDSGATWTERTSAGSRNWVSIASSSDGTKLAAVVSNDGYIHVYGPIINEPAIKNNITFVVDDSHVILNGIINTPNSVRGFEYGLTTNYGFTTTESGFFAAGNFSANISSLLPYTTYHFRGYATNSFGTSYGPDGTFEIKIFEDKTNSGTRSWKALTSSLDGTKLAAVVGTGYIYTSTDSGATWTERTSAGSRNWVSIASSSDGTKLVAVVAGGYIYTSTDNGATWTARTGPGSKYWFRVTSSSDGTKLAATIAGSGSGNIYTSSDSGVTWIERTNSGSKYWRSIASSSDGTKIIAGAYNDYVYISNDSGITWSAQTYLGSKTWNSVAISSDGTKLLAGAGFNSSSKLFASNNGGSTWIMQDNSPKMYWYSFSVSYDALKLIATSDMTNYQYIYNSSDGGINWTRQAPSGTPFLAISPNGQVVLKANGSYISMSIAPERTPPTISSFVIPSTSNSLTVPITTFTATDNIGVTGYKLTESETPPLAGDTGWTASAPTEYTFATTGSKTLYAWVKDAAGNISLGSSSSVVITDIASPTISSFIIPSTSNSLTVPITTFTATDNIGVTGYKLTESETPPLAGDAGWTASAPTEYTFATTGSKTLYAWAKDAAGNISTSSSASVSIDLEIPVVNSFSIPSTSNSLAVPINIFTATDNTGVTGYIVTESEIKPSSEISLPAEGENYPVWTETAPTRYVFATTGSKTLYAWVKDAAGNISDSLSASVVIDNTPPVSVVNSICSVVGNKCTIGGAVANPKEIYSVQEITGTASDNTGISKVEISIKDVDASKWYANNTFSSDSEVYYQTVGTTTWLYDLSTFPLTIGHTYQINVKATDLYDNVEIPISDSFKFVKQSFDTTAPVITLIGENPVSVVKGELYSDSGATALDETDGVRDVITSGTVNTSALGTYVITYTATDLSGNIGTATRNVNVILSDTYNITASAGEHGNISPEGIVAVASGADQTFTFIPAMSTNNIINNVEVVSEKQKNIEKKENVVVQNQSNPNTGAENYKVASITVDGQLVAPADSYTFTNVTTDHTISVTFSLIDAVPPEITLNGDNPMSLNTGEEYVEPGATATDAETSQPLEVVISGSVNTNVAGSYTITYMASDLSGNIATKERIVNVTDVTPPEISNISTPVISPNGTVIVWITNEPATSKVSWGTATGELTRETVLDPILTTYHVVSLSSSTVDINGEPNTLTPLKNYFFTVESADVGGNSTTSDEKTFSTVGEGGTIIINSTTSTNGILNSNTSNIVADTTAPTISNIKVSEVSSFGAVISFDTNEDTLPNIEYGRTINYGTSSGGDSWNEWKKSHSIKLKGLMMGTDYHFKIVAADRSGNIGNSEDQTFKTKFFSENLADITKIDNLEAFQKEIESAIESVLPSLVPPFVEKPIVSDITENSVVVSFKTNVKAFPVVGYMEDENFDVTKTNPYLFEASDTTKKSTYHSIKILNLKSNTKYHLQARAFSLPQVTGKSEDVVFTTQASKIHGSVVERKNDSFTIVWNTDEPTSSILEYKNTKTGKISKITDNTKNTSHSIKVENLTPGTTYEVKISGVNDADNLVEGAETITVNTSTDVTPPTISNFKVDSALVVGRNDKTQTIVSWTTDEPATSIVYYQEGSGSPDKELTNKKEDTELTMSHVAMLTTLKPGTVYRFQVASVDSANNLAKLPIRTIITPRPNESIVDVIFKNFDETFNFIKNVK